MGIARAQLRALSAIPGDYMLDTVRQGRLPWPSWQPESVQWGFTATLRSSRKNCDGLWSENRSVARMNGLEAEAHAVAPGIDCCQVHFPGRDPFDERDSCYTGDYHQIGSPGELGDDSQGCGAVEDVGVGHGYDRFEELIEVLGTGQVVNGRVFGDMTNRLTDDRSPSNRSVSDIRSGWCREDDPELPHHGLPGRGAGLLSRYSPWRGWFRAVSS